VGPWPPGQGKLMSSQRLLRLLHVGHVRYLEAAAPWGMGSSSGSTPTPRWRAWERPGAPHPGGRRAGSCGVRLRGPVVLFPKTPPGPHHAPAPTFWSRAATTNLTNRGPGSGPGRAAGWCPPFVPGYSTPGSSTASVPELDGAR